jgi:hypothetical protein
VGAPKPEFVSPDAFQSIWPESPTLAGILAALESVNESVMPAPVADRYLAEYLGRRIIGWLISFAILGAGILAMLGLTVSHAIFAMPRLPNQTGYEFDFAIPIVIFGIFAFISWKLSGAKAVLIPYEIQSYPHSLPDNVKLQIERLKLVLPKEARLSVWTLCKAYKVGNPYPEIALLVVAGGDAWVVFREWEMASRNATHPSWTSSTARPRSRCDPVQYGRGQSVFGLVAEQKFDIPREFMLKSTRTHECELTTNEIER